jgi:hypothetical protein
MVLRQRLSVPAGAQRNASRAVFRFTRRDRLDTEPEFVERRLVPIERPLLDGREAVAAKRGLRESCKLLGLPRGRRKSLSGFGHAIGESDPFCLFARYAAFGKDQIHRPAVVDQARQADGAEIHGRNAEPPTIDAERGIARRDPEVAPQGKLQSTGDGGAFDSSDHRFGELQACRTHRAIAVLDTMATMTRVGLLEVVSGAEGASRAGRDGNMLRSITIETAEGFGQGAHGRRIDRIARRRTVDRDYRHGAIDVAANRRGIWRRTMIDAGRTLDK